MPKMGSGGAPVPKPYDAERTYVPTTQWNHICALAPIVISKSVTFAFWFVLTPESRPPDLEEEIQKKNSGSVLLLTLLGGARLIVCRFCYALQLPETMNTTKIKVMYSDIHGKSMTCCRWKMVRWKASKLKPWFLQLKPYGVSRCRSNNANT